MLTLTWPPFIRSATGASRLWRMRMMGLTPAVAVALYLWPGPFLARLLPALAVPLIIHRWSRTHRGSAVQPGQLLGDAVLVSLLMPVAAGWYLPIGAIMFVAAGRWLLGDHDYVPALNLPVFAVAAVSLIPDPGPWLAPVAAWQAGAGTLARGSLFCLGGWAPALLSVAATAALTQPCYKHRVLLWSLAGAAATFLAGWQLAGGRASPAVLDDPVTAVTCLLWVAGILAAENAGSPVHGRAQACYGAIVGIIYGAFLLKGQYAPGMVFSILIPGLLVPWLDDRFIAAEARPGGSTRRPAGDQSQADEQPAA
jgi:Na+-translocating ferredoxin:NAD+ oxidoreductase RnfD subunit